MPRRFSSCVLLAALSALTAMARAADLLVPFSEASTHAFSAERLSFAMDGGALKLAVGKLSDADRDKSARLVIAAPGTPWNLGGRTLVTTIRNTGDKPLTVRLRAENDSASGLTDACEIPQPLPPGESREVKLRIVARPVDPTYAPFQPFMMYFKNLNVRDNSVDPKAIVRVIVSIDRAEAGQSIVVSPIELAGEPNDTPPPFLPFVDQYGQYVHSEWYGKIHSDADFKQRVEEESRERADWSGPKNWNEYGGWKDGPTLKATGFFRVEKHDGKWWLVDPAGNLFWSNAPTGVGFGGDVTPITDRENWFKELPSRDGEWASFYRNGRGATYRYYSDREWVGLDIGRVNLVRKYGPEYQKVVAALSHDRLRSWGFNSIGNWSAREVCELKRTPYTIPINSPGVSVMKWTDGHSFQDVYDPEWEPGLYRTMERERGRTANDPWCIGYFVDNERCIGWRPRAAAVGEITLKAPAGQPAKLKLLEQLKAKYGSVEKLNEAWKTLYQSWDQFLAMRDAPELKGRDNEPIMADLGDFGMAFCERYFSVARAAVKSVAPNQLFLGSRLYGHVDPAVMALAGKHWDVVSYNIYDADPTGRVNQYNRLDLPIMITEWGVKSDPTQTPFRGDQLSEDPHARARYIENYLTRAMRHPNLVGAHFFQYRDQPLSGRPDGEATLRGYVNIVDTPNFELVQTNRRLGYGMYEARAK